MREFFTTGAQLRVARVAAGLSQQQLADATDCHLNTVSRYEALAAVPTTEAADRVTEYLLEKLGDAAQLEDGFLRLTL